MQRANDRDDVASSIVDKLFDKQLAQKKQEELSEEEIKKYKKVFNRLLDSDDGIVFYEWLQKICGIHSADFSNNAYSLLGINGRRQVYTLLRSLLTKELRGKLERG